MGFGCKKNTFFYLLTLRTFQKYLTNHFTVISKVSGSNDKFISVQSLIKELFEPKNMKVYLVYLFFFQKRSKISQKNEKSSLKV